MESKELIKSDFPKPAPRRRGGSKQTKLESRRMGIEAAAIAYVQMENGEYRYAEGTPRKFDENHNPVPNKREVMRRAGYSPGSWDSFEKFLGDNENFWELVELHRMRRTDPNFRVEQENVLWRSVGGEALRNLYERVFYYPHTLTTEQYIRIIKLILDAGIVMNKIGSESENKSTELLMKLSPEQRERAMSGYRETLERELQKLDSLTLASRAADKE